MNDDDNRSSTSIIAKILCREARRESDWVSKGIAVVRFDEILLTVSCGFDTCWINLGTRLWIARHVVGLHLQVE